MPRCIKRRPDGFCKPADASDIAKCVSSRDSATAQSGDYRSQWQLEQLLALHAHGGKFNKIVTCTTARPYQLQRSSAHSSVASR